jgi:hypothetical protein
MSDQTPLDVEAIRARLDAALAHIRECMHIGLQDAKLYDEAGRKRIGEWADFIDKQIRAALAAPEMPRPPAEEAHSGPETPGTGSGRGTGVAEDENPAQECDDWFTDVAEAVRPAHYRQAAGELLALVAHFEHIGSERTEWMAGLRDGAEHLARSTSDPAPSLPVPSTEDSR